MKFCLALFLMLFAIANYSSAAIVFTAEKYPDRKAVNKLPQTDIYILNTSTGEEKLVTRKPSDKLLYSVNLHPVASKDGRRISYTSYRVFFDENVKKWKDWNGDVCTMAYGRPLTEEAYQYGYSYFPSAQYYASMLSHNWNVFIYDVDSGKEKQVSFFKWDEGDPHFIGNSNRVLYSLEAQKSIFILKTSGNKRGFEQIILRDNEVLHPDVSGDGRYLTFQSYIEGNWEIYTLRLADSYKDRIKTRLTRTTLVSELYPRWSPDGKTILFISDEGSRTNFNLFTMNVATKEKKQITKGAQVGYEYEYSPDGKRIAFVDFTTAKGGDIYVIDADGANKKRLTDGKSECRYPAWSPDGSRIAFIGNADKEPALYIMNTDGTGLHRASAQRAAWDQPVWY